MAEPTLAEQIGAFAVGVTLQTLLGGKHILSEGKVIGSPQGRFIRRPAARP